jgi:FKBP-type peptidyl-prolyl cis-trans isomerase
MKLPTLVVTRRVRDFSVVCIAAGLLAGLGGCATHAPPPAAAPAPPAPPPPNEHESYLFGLTYGEQMHNAGITDQLSLDAISHGIQDGLNGQKATRADQQVVQKFVQSVMATALANRRAAAKDFLAKNGQQPSVITTASGLQYKVLTPGDANAPAVSPSDQVTVNYRGTLIDGSEFDSSYTRGTPATFRADGVIKGWQEALVLMKPGAKWQLFIPPELAYDARAQPGIPGGSLLIFEVELLSAKPSAAPPQLPGQALGQPGQAPGHPGQASGQPGPAPGPPRAPQSHKAVSPPLKPTPNP